MPDDVLDLLGHADEPPMHVDPDRMIAGARRTRRARRTLVGAAALTGAALVVSGITLLPTPAPDPDPPTTPTGPGLRATPAGPSPTPPATSPAVGEAVWGTAHVMSQQTDRRGNRPVVYLSTDRMLCLGTIEDSGRVHPSSCRPVQAPAPDAFSTGQAWSQAGDLPAGVEAPEYAVGLVPADVTRVVARTEHGAVTAHLVPAPDPALGRLYWAATPPVRDGTDPSSRSRVAYRGSVRAFSCDYYACVTEQGTPAGDEPG